jgi:hypothetical protein
VSARDVLHHTFGHADSYGPQAGVIGEILAGRSALAVLPTATALATRCASAPRIAVERDRELVVARTSYSASGYPSSASRHKASSQMYHQADA